MRRPLPVLEGPRWSGAVTCPRRAVYDAIVPAADREPPDARTLAIWKRGRAYGDAITREIAEELAAEGRRPRFEEPVPWPARAPVGEGHIDLYVPHERHAIEAVSAMNDDAATIERKALQVAGYVLEHPRAERATVVIVNPSTGEQDELPIEVEAFEPRVREIQAAVVAGIANPAEAMPPRVCRHPHDGPTRWCPHVAPCFADWQRPTIEELVGGAELAERLLELDSRVTAARKATEQHELERELVRNELRAALPAGEEVTAGGVTLKRTVSVRRSLAIAKLEATGKRLPKSALPFVSESESERWTVKPARDA